MVRLLGIVGSRSDPSRTRNAVEVALEAAAAEPDVETNVLHLAHLDLPPADGTPLEELEGDVRRALDTIIDHDAYLVGTPVYRAGVSGVLKNLLDTVPRGRWQADVAPLEAAAVGLVATGASAHHFLAVDQELRPLLAFFGAHTVGSGAYLHGDHFEDKEVRDDDARHRLATLGLATVELSRAIGKSPNLADLEPQV